MLAQIWQNLAHALPVALKGGKYDSINLDTLLLTSRAFESLPSSFFCQDFARAPQAVELGAGVRDG
ncbi:hypothetical protein B0H17DRAFT_1113253 [Mycena rosella]|uniref:Uncharacterized protein n=1 Tax=Mycena rosella TaxID=1033263 RepID=A0AAD7BGZ4_MYCRO|nr:hypothetical protein B0H17DRAFT_1113253 [Mycena rosella]